MKCYFNDCPNTNCTTEVITGLSWDVETNQRTENWNPVCDSCIAKTNWTFLTTRSIREKEHGKDKEQV